MNIEDTRKEITYIRKDESIHNSADISFRESRHTPIYMLLQSIKYMKLTYVNKNKGKIHVKRTEYEKPYKNLVNLQITL